MTIDPLRNLERRLDERSSTIAVVGLGYVGLPLALTFAQAGYRVLGLDNDPSKVRSLNAGSSYLDHIPAGAIRRARDDGFEASDDLARATEADALLLCVPTPLNRYREPDLSYVTRTMDGLAPHLRPEQIVVLESTTYPGTTDEELRPRIEATGLEVGRDVFLVYSPEREDPGNATYVTRTIPKIVGGATPNCLRAGMALYAHAIDHLVPVSSTQAAEMTKLLENIYRAVNIGLVNEMKIIADRMGLDIFEIVDAAATKPFGFTPFQPGPGLGGHCIPIDPFYLTWKAREFGVHTRFIELAGEVNRGMPAYVVDKVAEALNVRSKSVHGSRIMVIGVAYKKNVNDMRESPAAEILTLLAARGAVLAYHDPYVPEFPRMRNYDIALTSTDLTAEAVASHDAVVIVTDHDDVDYDLIREHAQVIVDSRGRYRGDDANVVRG